jgi:hypothetical protein
MKNKVVFESSRKFLVERYSAGHGWLLLRSHPTVEYPRVLDVLFTDVRVMEMRTWSNGLEVVATGAGDARDSSTKPEEMIEDGLQVFRVSGSGWSGFIVAGQVSSKEGSDAPNTPGGLCEQ